jgi:DNA-directed RNA polymerase specialized sigma24 family protein/AcrR family transcriptional regulator
MDDVARAAGVTRLIVYRIFGSKEDLYRAVLDSVLVDLARSFGTRRSTRSFGTDPFDASSEGGFSAELLRVARRHPDGFRLLWRHAAHEPDVRAARGSFRAFAVGYAESLLATSMNDAHDAAVGGACDPELPQRRICTWLDDGDAARDAELVVMLSSGSRALVATWLRRRESSPRRRNPSASGDATKFRNVSLHPCVISSGGRGTDPDGAAETQMMAERGVDVGELFRTHRTKLVALASAITLDRDVAEEVVQDAFANLQRRLDRVDDAERYLHRSVVKPAASACIRRRRLVGPSAATPCADGERAGGRRDVAGGDEPAAAAAGRRRPALLAGPTVDAIAETLGWPAGP